MQIKKSEKASLEKDKLVYVLMGLVFVLSLVYVALEWTEREVTKYEVTDTEFLFEEENDESRIAWGDLKKVVLLYNSEEERLSFESFLESKPEMIAQKIEAIDRFDYINTGEPTKTEEYKKRLRTGIALNTLLKEFREKRD